MSSSVNRLKLFPVPAVQVHIDRTNVRADVLPSTTALVGGDCCEGGGTRCGAVTWGCSDLAGTFKVGFFPTSFVPFNPSSPVAALASQPVGFLECRRCSSSVRVSLLKAVAAQKVQ